MSTTVSAAAGLAHVSAGTIVKLIKLGHLKADQTHKKARYRILTPRGEIRRIVLDHAPSAGWKKSDPVRKVNGTPVQVALRMPPERGTGLRDVLAFAALDDATRGTLLQLAERFTAEELALLLTL